MATPEPTSLGIEGNDMTVRLPRALSLRPAGEEDIAFCEILRRSNMAAYHSARGVALDPERFVAGWSAFENFMLQADGEVAGMLRLLVADDALEIRDLQLLPAHRNRGIGSWAVDWTLAEADRRGLARVRLRVFVENPALRLYSRLGFKVDSMDEQGKVQMSCVAGASK